MADPVSSPGIYPWQSKTILINGIVGLIAFVGLFLQAPAAQSGSWIQGHMAEVGMAWSFLNVVIRFITKDKIVLSD